VGRMERSPGPGPRLGDRRAGGHPGFADAFQLSGAVIALMHGKSGEYWWSGGNCVALEVNEQPDTASGESVDVLVVTAAHLIDRGPVEGTVRATASNGTVNPQEGDVPRRST